MRATVAGGLKGLAGGLALALPGAYLLNQRWAYYRALPRNLKAFGIVVVAVPSFIIPAEHAGMRFEKLRWCVPLRLAPFGRSASYFSCPHSRPQVPFATSARD